MEEIKESYRILTDCANVANILKTNKTLSKSSITVNVTPRDFPELLSEI